VLLGCMVLLGSAGCAPFRVALDSRGDPLPRCAILRLGTTRFRHESRLFCLALSPNGKLAATGGDDDYVYIWSVPDGKRLHELRLPPYRRTARVVNFSADGKWLAASDGENTYIWRVASGRHLRTIKRASITAGSMPTFTSDARMLLTTYAGTITLWNTRNWTKRLSIAADTPQHIRRTSPAWLHMETDQRDMPALLSSDGAYVVSGHSDGTLRLWNVLNGSKRATLKEHRARITCMGNNGERLVSGSSDGELVAWDKMTRKAQIRIRAHSGGIRQIVSLPGNDKCITTGADGVTRVWDIGLGRELGAMNACVGPVACSADKDLLLAGSRGNAVSVWSLDKRAELTNWGHSAEINCIAYSPDGAVLATGSDDRSVRVWDVRNGKELYCLLGHRQRVLSVAFSADGRMIASGAQDGTVKLWKADSGACIRTIRVSEARVTCVRFAPLSDQLVSCGYDQPVRFWEPVTGRPIREVPVSDVATMAFSKNGSRMALACGHYAQIIDAKTSRLMHKVHHGYHAPIQSVAFLSAGKMLVLGSKDHVGLYQTRTGRRVRRLTPESTPSKDMITACGISEVCRIAACAKEGKLISMISLVSGDELSSLRSHRDIWPNAVAFSPDGRFLASTEGTTALIWNMSRIGHQVNSRNYPSEALTSTKLPSVDMLVGQLRSRDWFRREEAARRLTYSGLEGKLAIPHLSRTLGDDDLAVAYSARIALTAIGLNYRTEVKAALVGIIRGEPTEARRNALMIWADLKLEKQP